MSLKQSIIEYLESHDSAASSELSVALGVTRQALNRHIRQLIEAGDIVKTGSTRGARYYSPKNAPKTLEFTNTFVLGGLEEAQVYKNLADRFNLKKKLSEAVESITHYAFTEMLNNAIDHSGSDNCELSFRLGPGKVSFEVRDQGVGVFKSIADKFDLLDEHAAMMELIKGKTTTMPSHHTGEGLFFTSKVADRFILRSHQIQLEWSRQQQDVFLSELNYYDGTIIQFEIARSSKTQLDDLFSKYAPEEFDYQFQRTVVNIKLTNTSYISRSEAKRITNNLNKFREVTLDFKDVKTLGQGFADEVFRVFQENHPGVKIVTVNSNDAISAMIRHVGGHVE